MEVLLLTKYDESGASSRYRTLQYLEYLQSREIKISIDSLLDNTYIEKIFSKQKPSWFYYLRRFFKRIRLLIFSTKKYDLYWIEGELFPYLPFFIEKLLLPKRFIVEYDDAIFHNYDMHRYTWVRKLLGRKIPKIMQRSEHVIVGNEYVKQYALLAGARKVTILPTVVDANKYIPVQSQHVQNKVTIGWLGSPTTVKYLSFIESALISVAKKANVKLMVIGGEYQLNGIETECHHWPDKWSEKEEIALLKQIDIGIMPLIDSPWEKGKCGFKLIKYMACGKPMIASPVSTNCDIIVHGENGFLAETLKQWEEFLLALVSDHNQRKDFGSAGRKRMVENYSLQYTAPILHTILNDVFNINRGAMCVE